MPKPAYIAIGNHRSYVGIKEIIYSIQSALRESVSVKLTRELKSNSVNIIIIEFSGRFDLAVIKKTKELYPDTKIVIVATEFATPVSVLGLELTKTFNFFGTRDDWAKLIPGSLRPLAGGMPSYMQMRYLGFVRALQYCDLLHRHTSSNSTNYLRIGEATWTSPRAAALGVSTNRPAFRRAAEPALASSCWFQHDRDANSISGQDHAQPETKI